MSFQSVREGSLELFPIFFRLLEGETKILYIKYEPTEEGMMPLVTVTPVVDDLNLL